MKNIESYYFVHAQFLLPRILHDFRYLKFINPGRFASQSSGTVMVNAALTVEGKTKKRNCKET